MNQQQLFSPVPRHKLESLSKEEMLEFIDLQGRVIDTINKDNDRLRVANNELKQKTLYIEEQYITIKNKFFGKSSEKQASAEDKRKHQNKNRKKKKKVQLPSLRYAEAPLIEREVELQDLPSCKCCGTEMKDSGMTENSEFITVIPSQYVVIRQKRHKYRCVKCHGDIVTAPAPPRIKPGSSYSDEMIIDVAVSKYCDLIPVERYVGMAKRNGLSDLPPQSLIELTHVLADFAKGAYDKLKEEVSSEKVLHADETPHRMLERNDNKSWYLWGFSTRMSCYFEIHDTRSGDVASKLLKDSACEFLVSDVFSGYGKAVKESNVHRKAEKLVLIKNVYCNAHARRKFRDSESRFPEEADYFVKIYGKIYRLNEMTKRWPKKTKRLRQLMLPLFEEIKSKSLEMSGGYSTKSSIGKAMSYFLKNYGGLTLFLVNPLIPIDNNSQESLLRNPVIGRKTWLGTHSIRGAETNAILFSLVESCKLNKVNPREYFKKLVQDLHNGKEPYTPKDYAHLQK
ncbi:MAG: IS66 family transposase [Bdellovibrionaceae bacterium]|nr:IS66 family transposase [Pseudobdellovibrionaceae bacterium]